MPAVLGIIFISRLGGQHSFNPQALAEAKSEETVESGMEGKLRFLKMPTRKDLEAEGHTRLVRGIMSAGGFSSVAQRLGLRTRRRPNGFWEDLGNVDEVSFARIK